MQFTQEFKESGWIERGILLFAIFLFVIAAYIVIEFAILPILLDWQASIISAWPPYY